MENNTALTPAEALTHAQEAFLARLRLMLSHRDLARIVYDPEFNPLDFYDAAAADDFRRFTSAFERLLVAGELDTLGNVDRATARTVLDFEYGDEFSGASRDLMVNLKAIEIRAAARLTADLTKAAA